MEYYAYLKQKGGGCDYTIGCGNTMVKFEADSDDQAKIELSRIIEEEFTGDLELSEVSLMKGIIEFDLRNLYDNIKNEEDELRESEQIESEKKEYERLRNKFENK